ncbi:hypothetical protein ACLOJK_009146 [Asimina triloba]
MSKAWGIGAWAADVERAEAEEQEAAAAASAESSQSFPSLKEATAAKPKKKKPMTLSEFTTGSYVGPGGGKRDYSENKGLTPEEMRRLPTGPKERTPEELEYGRLGGGFRSFSRPAPVGRMRERSDEGGESWGGGGGGGRRPYGGFDEERGRGPPPRASEFDQPSRADEVDNWAATKKSSVVVPLDSGRHDRYGSLGSGSASRADEVDNWASGKKPLPARSGGFGSGFRDSGMDSDRWSRGGPPREAERERPRLVLDPPRVDAGGSANELVRNRPSPFGAARPREEVLAEKGVDWRKVDSEIEIKKTSRPTSSHSSRPSSAQSSRPGSPPAQAVEGAGKHRQKVNPFGDAKPREVLLKEQGKDWRKIDLELEHRRIDSDALKGQSGTPFSILVPISIVYKLMHLLVVMPKECLSVHKHSLYWMQVKSFTITPGDTLKPVAYVYMHLEVIPADHKGYGYSERSFCYFTMPETEEERKLKEEIDSLKKIEVTKQAEVNVNGESTLAPSEEQVSLREQISSLEVALQQLTLELDDKVRFGQRTGERPSSQSGILEDSRSMELTERPRSRGTVGDVWTRSGGEERRTFQGSRERGFLSGRDMDRGKCGGIEELLVSLSFPLRFVTYHVSGPSPEKDGEASGVGSLTMLRE